MSGNVAPGTRRALPRCPEARILASDFDLKAAIEGEVLPPKLIPLLRAGFESPVPGEQIAAAVELRSLLAERYSVQRLQPLLAGLRDRLWMLRGGAAPEPVKAEASEAALLAGVQTSLEELKLIYTFLNERDVRVSNIRRWTMIWLGSLYGALLVIFLIWQVVSGLVEADADAEAVNSVLNYTLIAAVAAAGAAISILQRSQTQASSGVGNGEPILQVSALRHGLVGVLVSGMAGPALAMILVPVFASGLVTIAGLTPTFQNTCGSIANFRLLDHCVSLGWQNAAKMLVWAFLAGFAERLVPDVLDSVVGRVSTGLTDPKKS